MNLSGNRSGKKVLILGAGVTGLSAAWRLSEAGYEVEVIEATQHSGGIARSQIDDGFVLDFGIHGLYSARPETKAIVQEMHEHFSKDFIEISKKTAIFFRQKYMRYPFGMREIFLSVPWITSLNCQLKFCIARFNKHFARNGASLPSDQVSYLQWVKERFGRPLYDLYFGPYTEKVWGLPGEKLASSWLARRIEELSFSSIIKRLWKQLIKSQDLKKEMQSLQPARFLYPPKGSNQFISRIREAAVSTGTVFVHGSKAARMELVRDPSSDQQVKVEVQGPEGETKVKTADYVVSTIPLPALIKLFGDKAPESAQQAARRLRYRAMIIVNLFFDKPQVYPYQWVYYSDPKMVMNRVNEFTNLGPGFSPEGKTAINCEITCWEDDEIWNTDPDLLAQRCIEQLAAIGVFKADEVRRYTHWRNKHAYPVYDLGCEARVSDCLDFIENTGNVFSLGRQGRFEYINQDECIWHATRCAEQITQKAAEQAASALDASPRAEDMKTAQPSRLAIAAPNSFRDARPFAFSKPPAS